jgi:hypothetical protein
MYTAPLAARGVAEADIAPFAYSHRLVCVSVRSTRSYTASIRVRIGNMKKALDIQKVIERGITSLRLHI